MLHEFEIFHPEIGWVLDPKYVHEPEEAQVFAQWLEWEKGWADYEAQLEAENSFRYPYDEYEAS
jgi:hypothetical protein